MYLLIVTKYVPRYFYWLCVVFVDSNVCIEIQYLPPPSPSLKSL
jgi:hypothetical protein